MPGCYIFGTTPKDIAFTRSVEKIGFGHDSQRLFHFCNNAPKLGHKAPTVSTLWPKLSPVLRGEARSFSPRRKRIGILEGPPDKLPIFVGLIFPNSKRE